MRCAPARRLSSDAGRKGARLSDDDPAKPSGAPFRGENPRNQPPRRIVSIPDARAPIRRRQGPPMKIPSLISRRIAWLNFPTAALIALLQRTPILNFLVGADEGPAIDPIGAIVRSAVAAASLGAVDTLAGATILTESNNQDPVTVTAGSPIQPIVFSVSNTINIGSWKVGGTLPPGLELVAAQDGS